MIARPVQVFGDRPKRCTVGMHKIKVRRTQRDNTFMRIRYQWLSERKPNNKYRSCWHGAPLKARTRIQSYA